MKGVLLFDLDETLMVDERSALAAFDATARLAASLYEVGPSSLAHAARAHARELWYRTPAHAYCVRVGISAWEGLWCRFEGDEPNVAWLREWSATYRRETWRLALADQGVSDAELAEGLGEWFAMERRERHEVFPDVLPALNGLGDDYRLALVTNGASCLQREKLAASGLGDHFALVVVSADLGIGKPAAALFRHALAQLYCDGKPAVMIGDSLWRDIDGAIAAGLDAVWINRLGRSRPDAHPDAPEVVTLSDLAAALSTLG